MMDWQQLEERFFALTERGSASLKAGRLAEAELCYEEATAISNMAAFQQPTVDTFTYHAIATFNLAAVLKRLGASPEAIPLLDVAAHYFREVIGAGSTEQEYNLVMVLIELAKAHQGGKGYIDLTRPPIFDIDEMRAYRRERMANGTWLGPMASLVAPDDREAAEAPLLEALAMLRRLVRTSRADYEGALALTLNLLGETYLDVGREAESEAPLREAEAMYRMLCLSDASRYQPLLTDTLSLLSRASVSGGGTLDRVSVLEELVPGLRVEAFITEDEREHGMTISKSNARDRLCEVLKELADLYRESGQSEKATSLWNGELGVLMTESRNVRWG